MFKLQGCKSACTTYADSGKIRRWLQIWTPKWVQNWITFSFLLLGLCLGPVLGSRFGPKSGVSHRRILLLPADLRRTCMSNECMLFLSLRPALLLVQSRSLSRRHVCAGFLDPALGAIMQQVCWHSRRSKAYRGLPRGTRQELLWKKPPLRTSTCGRHRFRRNDPLWAPRMWQGP